MSACFARVSLDISHIATDSGISKQEITKILKVCGRRIMILIFGGETWVASILDTCCNSSGAAVNAGY